MADNTVQLRALLASIAALPDALNKALNTRTAPNSLKLAGKTLEEIRAAIKTATDADIKVVSDLLAAFIARRDNPNQVTKDQVGLGLVENFAVATPEQGIAGTATNLYLTPAVLKAALDAFWSDMAGAAPETLDTINEIAAALNNDPDVVKNLTTLVGANKTAIETLKTQVEGLSTSLDGRLDVLETASADYATRLTAVETDKLDKTAQAADSKLFEGKTLAQVIAEASSNVDLSNVDAKTLEGKSYNDILRAIVGRVPGTGTPTDLVTGSGFLDSDGSYVISTADLGSNVSAQTTNGREVISVTGTGTVTAGGRQVNLDQLRGYVLTIDPNNPLLANEALLPIRITAYDSTTNNGMFVGVGTARPDSPTQVANGQTVTDATDDAPVVYEGVVNSSLTVIGISAGASPTKLTAASFLVEVQVNGTWQNIHSVSTGGTSLTLVELESRLAAFIANKASAEEAVAGTDDSKYITALGLKAATTAAIDALVDGAPTALDTLKELADLLASEGDALAALVTTVDGKLGKTEKAADSSKLDGQTLQQIIAGLRGEAQGTGLALSAINVRSFYSDGAGSNNIIPMANVQSVNGISASIGSDGTFLWDMPASVASEAALGDRLWSFEVDTGKAFGSKVRATLKKLVVAQPGGAEPVKTLGANEVNSGDLYFFDGNIQSSPNVQPNAGNDSLQLNVPQELTLSDSTHVALSRYGNSSTILELQVLLEVEDGQGGWVPLFSTGAGAPGDSSLTILGLRDEAAARAALAEGRLSALENGETAADGRLDALEPRVAAAEGDIDALQADIATLKADDAAVDGRLDSAETRLTALEGADTALDGRLDTLETDNTATKDRLTALESGETAADGRLDALEPRVEANETDIAALKTGKLDKTGQAADSKLLEGKTVAQITEAITGGSTETLKALRDALDAFIANKASAEEAVAGTNDSKYITAVGLKAATDAAIAALVDGAPTALDTLKELADKLVEEGDALAALVTQVDQKLDKTAQAADSKLLEGKTAAQVIEGLATQNDLQLAVDKMTRSFEDAVDEIDGLSRLRASVTIAKISNEEYGFEGSNGSITPNALFGGTIKTLKWNFSSALGTLTVSGNHTSEDVRQLILADQVGSLGASDYNSTADTTEFRFTFDDLSTLPTTGTLPVAVRYA